ncbi:phenolphthiocerol synthesis polyketide synthase type I Pks15/1 [Elysia marginata]|uniref:Phenolphthiocerol synthesis polyketide synthase type I Pks15/1 n=1 Tax=Elysia marginata TaxID=1093978 RepID=A0AAV4HUS3_9GAST|nr:phenolphthiocerol synthesis polyketide synthase type I Pks15/1 [Elysia marginata]
MHHWDQRRENDPDLYNKWKCEHKCKLNHKSSAGAMESEGSVLIFGRSKARLRLRFIEYLGDGDSSSYKKVKESKPYGEDVEIMKLECVGHVQKRVGNRLRRMKNEKKGVKLSDGKNFGRNGQINR